ncbi:MAG: glycosyltransferase [Bacteroidetes bacterium]|jgi:glycosyltransferase involved in cell wall biosynthesis|nr:glycosyltransferase [Bacteroidota bacterium]
MNEQTKPKVSVIILAYNHEKYIRETLEGAVRQQTDFPFDVYVHDDASRDETPNIIREYQDRYPHLIKPIFQKENQLMKGVKISQKFVFPLLDCDYIAFCEGDDYWSDPKKLSRQVAFLEENPEYVYCAHDVEMIYEDGMAVKEVFYEKPHEGSFSFTFLDQYLSHFASTPTLMVRSALMIGAPDHESVVSGDLYYNLYFLSKGKGYYLEDKMVVKRRNKGGITGNSEYRKKVAKGTYLLWKEVLMFAPKEYRALVRFKVAEYQRQLLKNRSLAPEISGWELLVGAFRNNPWWFIGQSEAFRARLLRKARSMGG